MATVTSDAGTLVGLTDGIAAELAAVEARFAEELTTDLRCVNTLVRHVGRFRGKMLRPCLVLLAGRACSPGVPLSDAHVTLATVVEMVHMATLVHDDVLDDAELRRKGATINHLRGNEAARPARRLPDQPQLPPLFQPPEPVRQPTHRPDDESGLRGGTAPDR